jgi:uncharacterized protein YndB with AHSA1/START domain
MKTIKREVHIEASPSTLYQYLSDPRHMTEWVASMEDIRNVRGDGVGRTHDWTYRMAGVKLKGHTELIEDVPNSLIKTRTTGGVESTWTFVMAPDAKGSRLSLTVEYKLPVPVLGKLAEALVVRRNEREADLSLQHLQDLVKHAEGRQHAAE